MGGTQKMIVGIVIYLLVFILIMVVLLHTAPHGFEDRNGFHYMVNKRRNS